MAQILWNIVVQPLVYMIELVYSLFWRFTGVPGIAIVGVSIAVNLFCLPLYRMADAAQERERQKQASMERWVTHIKKHFKGDQQYMMLSAYYREQNYHPLQALVGSISLLLQIPFFTAAYSYLSNLEMLKGVSFLFLRDLGAPDAMFTIGGFDVNVMPIAMTLINCFSTYVYTKGLPLRDKVQAYGLAAIFLWLLYDSPSGLVFYWTCNQVFSLAKNVFMKVLKDPRTWALVLEQVAAMGAVGWLAAGGHLSTSKIMAVVVAAFALFELLWLRAWRAR
ncbi:MAG: membrane protein insertase YidC, partial [Atopobiaceae bacterium]|nr:membrane protein insertase YidC [Atopobiaceae bacterium]